MAAAALAAAGMLLMLPTGGRMLVDLAAAPCRVELVDGGVYPAPPPPVPVAACTFLPDMQLSDPGSKHTSPPVPAADEHACCIACMEDVKCFGAELYGQSCYKKTAPLPLVKQIPPKGVPLVACVKNHTRTGPPSSSHAPRRGLVAARVPGDIIAALERAGQLGLAGNESIYHGLNLKKASVQAAQNASYWLNCTVLTSATFRSRSRHTLIVDGLDYNASIFVNDRLIGTHAGPYRTARLPLSGGGGGASGPLLQPSNEVSFLFHMPPQGLIGGWLAPGNGVQGVMWEYLDYWKSMVGIGYDFAQPLWSIGVQEGAWLAATDTCLMSDLSVLPVLSSDLSQALINASVDLSCGAAPLAGGEVVTWT
jgi:hypothetical protein